MAEYIEREALMRRIKEIHCAECDSYHGVRCRACWVDDTLDYIDSEPAADVAPVVHGRWTAQCVVETDGGWALEDMPYNEYQHSNPICSVCRKTALLDGGEDYVTSPYCPNCGAKMDLE